MGKTIIPITISSSNEYFPFLIVLLTSIISNSTKVNEYRIFILSSGMFQTNKKRINDIVKPIDNFSIEFIDITNYFSNRDLYTNYHINMMTYARLTIIDCMNEYDKVIYLDCDTIVNCDLSDLYRIDISNYYVGAVRDTLMTGWMCMDGYEEQKAYNKQTIKLSSWDEYFNAGVLLLNIDNIKKKYTTHDLLDIAESNDWKWFDQDVLNKEFQGKVKLIDNKWNVMVHCYANENEIAEYYLPKEMYSNYMQAIKDPKIIHYAGRCIPCFEPTVDLAHFFWRYARKTEAYEEILFLMMKKISNINGKRKCGDIFNKFNQFIKRLRCFCNIQKTRNN